MTQIILHNYPQSPVAEKVRVGLGIKGLAWASVEIPRIPPKPLLLPLTGGYRRTPVMQIGADIYCDSQCILREIDRRHPQFDLMPPRPVGKNARRSTPAGTDIEQSRRALDCPEASPQQAKAGAVTAQPGVDAIELGDVPNACGRGDVDLGQRIADDIQTNQDLPVLAKHRPNGSNDLFLSRR